MCVPLESRKKVSRFLFQLFPQLDELEKKVRAANMTCGMVKGEIPALKEKYEQNKLLVETVEEGEKKAFNDSRFAMSVR